MDLLFYIPSRTNERSSDRREAKSHLGDDNDDVKNVLEGNRSLFEWINGECTFNFEGKLNENTDHIVINGEWFPILMWIPRTCIQMVNRLRIPN